MFFKAFALYFYIIPKESISKIMKNKFYLIEKLFLFSSYSFFVIFPFPQFPDPKGQMKLK